MACCAGPGYEDVPVSTCPFLSVDLTIANKNIEIMNKNGIMYQQ